MPCNTFGKSTGNKVFLQGQMQKEIASFVSSNDACLEKVFFESYGCIRHGIGKIAFFKSIYQGIMQFLIGKEELSIFLQEKEKGSTGKKGFFDNLGIAISQANAWGIANAFPLSLLAQHFYKHCIIESGSGSREFHLSIFHNIANNGKKQRIGSKNSHTRGTIYFLYELFWIILALRQTFIRLDILVSCRL